MDRSTPSPRSLARLAGLFYLIIIVAGITAEGVLRAPMVVPGDPAATTANVQGSLGALRVAFVGDLVMLLADVSVAALFYVLLRPVSHVLALLAMAFRLMQAAVLGANLLTQVAVFLILGTPAPAVELVGLVPLLMEVHAHGYDLGLVFFAFSCFTVGILIRRSSFLPGWLGLASMAAGLVYLTGGLTRFLAPESFAAIQPLYGVPLLAELSLCLWLLVKGLDVERWNTAASRA